MPEIALAAITILLVASTSTVAALLYEALSVLRNATRRHAFIQLFHEKGLSGMVRDIMN